MGGRIEVVNVWTEGVNIVATTKDEATARRYTAEVAPGSLTAARLRLADAAEVFIGATTTEWFDRYTALRVASFDVAALRTARGEG